MFGRLMSFIRADPRKIYYWVGSFCFVVGILMFLVLILNMAFHDKTFMPIFVSGYCAIFATLLSLFLILEHLTCFSDPECQTKIVRIVFMVPLYAIISWISLMAPSASEYLNLIRDAYESYAIYAFFQLMIALMGGIDTLYRALMIEEHPPINHICPLSYCMNPIKITPTFIQNCRLCLFQFMVLKPVVTVIVIILTAEKKMGNGLLDVKGGYFWTTLVYNFSITIAFTALLYFYQGLKHFMEGKNALMKFLCVKSVVFLSFWQGMVIALFSAANLLPTFSYWSPEETPTALQNMLICIEMMFVAFAHRYCFGSEEYQHNVSEDNVITDCADVDGMHVNSVPPIRLSVWENLKYTLKHEDILSDMRDIMGNR